MRQEEKKLLLADLCARLPFGVKIKLGDYDYQVCGYNSEKEMPLKIWYYYNSNLSLKSYIDVYLIDYLPYLRPMSSMTEEERAEFYKVGGIMSHKVETDTYVLTAFSPEAYNWLNKKMFDYRGLIEKGLAIEALKGMYKVEKQ